MLVQVKEKTHKERKKEVVYEVVCKDCNQKYIGEAKSTPTTMVNSTFDLHANAGNCAHFSTNAWFSVCILLLFP